MKRILQLVFVCAALGCRPDDTAHQERLKAWTATQENQMLALTESVDRLTKLRTPPPPKFSIVTVNTSHYVRIYKIEELSGESWLYLDGETNHLPGWLKLGYLEFMPDIINAAKSQRGYDWVTNDAVSHQGPVKLHQPANATP